jgi:glycosyltransferase involved in cell wall biosynthesis
MGGGTDPVASVLVGSCNGGEMVFVLLRALAAQEGGVPFEVVVADRCTDGTAERIAGEHPGVVLLRAAPDTTLPQLRALALARSRGRIVLVTEDHVVPPRDWVARLVTALDGAPARVAAVGGPVDNAERTRATDWAAFLCEYHGFLPPLPGGEAQDVPGMNVAYRRDALLASSPEALAGGFWESTVHPRLRAEGRTFLCVPDVVVMHRKRFGFAYFLAQRWHYSRYYAGRRFGPGQLPRRLAYAALAAGALPPVVLWRVARAVLARPAYRGAFLHGLAPMIPFAVAWGLGETAGYLAGPGASLARIE